MSLPDGRDIFVMNLRGSAVATAAATAAVASATITAAAVIEGIVVASAAAIVVIAEIMYPNDNYSNYHNDPE